MKKKFDLKNNKPLAIALIASVLIVLIVLTIVLQRREKNRPLTQEEVEQAQEEILLNELAEGTEQERQQKYLSMFIENIENKNYSKAYSMLYQGFKDRYFRTEEEFENYCKEYFPEMISMEFRNIERLGNIYVLVENVSDALNGSKNNTKSMYFVIQEEGYNNFKLSFSVNSLKEV